MFTIEQFNSPEFLNVFVDAGIRKYDYKIGNVSASGVMIYYRGQLVHSQVCLLKNSTNNIGELLALYVGVLLGAEYKKNTNALHPSEDEPKIKYINIFSDSAYSVNCITEWFKNWLPTRNGQKKFIGSNGKPVKNQELIETIIRLVNEYGDKINFIKVRGHQDPNNEKSVNLVSKYLEEANISFARILGVNNFNSPTKEVVKTIIKNNNMVDQLAGSMYSDNLYQVEQLPTLDDIFPVAVYSLRQEEYDYFLSLTQNYNLL